MQAGADPNNQNNYGRTPLHWAAKYNKVKVVEVLLNAGAHLNIQDKDGRTPLQLASVYPTPERSEAAKLILKAGADPNSQDEEGWTPRSSAFFILLKRISTSLSDSLE